eukprot:COSAG01_NODE_297_length_19258_cov_8.905110_9_plen_386_part_00
MKPEAGPEAGIRIPADEYSALVGVGGALEQRTAASRNRWWPVLTAGAVGWAAGSYTYYRADHSAAGTPPRPVAPDATAREAVWGSWSDLEEVPPEQDDGSDGGLGGGGTAAGYAQEEDTRGHDALVLQLLAAWSVVIVVLCVWWKRLCCGGKKPAAPSRSWAVMDESGSKDGSPLPASAHQFRGNDHLGGLGAHQLRRASVPTPDSEKVASVPELPPEPEPEAELESRPDSEPEPEPEPEPKPKPKPKPKPQLEPEPEPEPELQPPLQLQLKPEPEPRLEFESPTHTELADAGVAFQLLGTPAGYQLAAELYSEFSGCNELSPAQRILRRVREAARGASPDHGRLLDGAASSPEASPASDSVHAGAAGARSSTPGTDLITNPQHC